MTTTHTFLGRSFEFKDPVIAEGLIGYSEEKRCGRLIQARKGVGAFGSDIFLIRRPDGQLATFENVMLLPYKGELAMDPCEEDDTETEYTINHEHPETGFVIEHPQQPESERQSFSMMVTGPKEEQ